MGFCANLVRPSAPTSWHKLSDPLPIQLKTDETYAEPKPQELTIEELSIDLKDPEVSMPNPKSALSFPKTQLFKRAAALEAANYVAPQPGNANKMSKTAAAEERKGTETKPETEPEKKPETEPET